MRLYPTLALLAIAAAPVAALADNVNLSTGTAPYSVNGSAAVDSTVNPGWTASIPGAVWINNNGSGTTSVANGPYVFTTVFTLSSTSNLSGLFASDNATS